MTHNLTPFEVCERLIGKPEQIAAAAGLQSKAAYHWRREREGRAAGDLPSARVQRALLAYSAARDLGLKADHLIWGAQAAEIDTILSHRQPRGVAA